MATLQANLGKAGYFTYKIAREKGWISEEFMSAIGSIIVIVIIIGIIAFSVSLYKQWYEENKDKM